MTRHGKRLSTNSVLLVEDVFTDLCRLSSSDLFFHREKFSPMRNVDHLIGGLSRVTAKQCLGNMLMMAFSSYIRPLMQNFQRWLSKDVCDSVCELNELGF